MAQIALQDNWVQNMLGNRQMYLEGFKALAKQGSRYKSCSCHYERLYASSVGLSGQGDWMLGSIRLGFPDLQMIKNDMNYFGADYRVIEEEFANAKINFHDIFFVPGYVPPLKPQEPESKQGCRRFTKTVIFQLTEYEDKTLKISAFKIKESDEWQPLSDHCESLFEVLGARPE